MLLHQIFHVIKKRVIQQNTWQITLKKEKWKIILKKEGFEWVYYSGEGIDHHSLITETCPNLSLLCLSPTYLSSCPTGLNAVPILVFKIPWTKYKYRQVDYIFGILYFQISYTYNFKFQIYIVLMFSYDLSNQCYVSEIHLFLIWGRSSLHRYIFIHSPNIELLNVFQVFCY